MSKIVVEGYIVVPEKDLDAIASALPTHIRLTREEKGCIKFEVAKDTIHKNRFNVYEEFVDREAFDAHQTRARSSTWSTLSGNAKRHYNVKEVL